MKISEIDILAQQLKERLKIPLPGREAQARMAPRPIEESRFRENPHLPAKPGGVMVLLYPKQGDLYLPLMKRPSYNGAHSGQVSLPGGKVEEVDLDLTDTALREAQEEIGVERNEVSVLGRLTDLFIVASNFKVSPTVGFVNYAPKFIPDPREVEAVLEVSVAQLFDEAKKGIEEMRFGSYVIHSPYFDVEGHRVWGATAMILSELLALLSEFD